MHTPSYKEICMFMFILLFSSLHFSYCGILFWGFTLWEFVRRDHVMWDYVLDSLVKGCFNVNMLDGRGVGPSKKTAGRSTEAPQR